MDKYEMIEKLQNAGIDVASELAWLMDDEQAEELLRRLASIWSFNFDFDKDEEAPRA